jgi:hypothetical protein
VKTDLDPLAAVTRVYACDFEDLPSRLFPPPPMDDVQARALVAFIDRQRFNWTRTIGVEAGPPSPVYYAHLYAGDTYIGYFAVGAAALPGSSAFFRVRYAKLFAQKRVSRSDANQFLDLIGVGGELR